MKVSKLLPIFVFAFVFAGCTTKAIVQKDFSTTSSAKYSYEFIIGEGVSVPQETQNLIKSTLDQELTDLKLFADSYNSANRHAQITFNFYNMRSGTARAVAGVFAGTDKLDTNIKVFDQAADNALIGEFQIVSKNNTAWGTANGFAEKHAKKIAQKLSGSE